MKFVRANLLLGLVLVLALAVTAFGQAPAAVPGMASGQADTLSYESQRALVDQYCFYCHDDDLRTGGLTLTELDLEHVERSAELAEKVIRKLRGGVMPPLGQPRPDARTIKAFASSLEAAIDQAAAAQPNPGRPLHAAPLRGGDRRQRNRPVPGVQGRWRRCPE
jgi:hypothetical protein